VEADKRLAEVLRENLRDYKNIEIVEEDILKFSIFNPPRREAGFQFSNKLQIPNFKTKIQNTEYEIQDTKFQNYGYKIVANLPYQITSAVFRKFLENEPRPSEMTVMVQKEVAERICGGPGEMSLLSVSVQFFGKPEIVKVAPRRVFWPEPEVDSAILKISQIKNKSEANLKRIRSLFVVNSLSDSRVALKEFFRVVKIGFSARRKQLHNNLSGGLHLSDEKIKEVLIRLGFDPKIRAQDLSVEDWMKLANQLFVKY
jgi:16S rRNA (adenine1518-N6/adenine1519-N6)-dimethyltransferase